MVTGQVALEVRGFRGIKTAVRGPTKTRRDTVDIPLTRDLGSEEIMIASYFHAKSRLIGKPDGCSCCVMFNVLKREL